MRDSKDHKLQQKDAQIRTLLKVFSSIIYDSFEDEDPYVQLPLRLNKIITILMVPTILRSSPVYADTSIMQLQLQRRELFAAVNPINKEYDVWSRYFNCGLRLGPKSSFDNMRFEIKHAIFTKIAHMTGNYQDIALTSVDVTQF